MPEIAKNALPIVLAILVLQAARPKFKPCSDYCSRPLKYFERKCYLYVNRKTFVEMPKRDESKQVVSKVVAVSKLLGKYLKSFSYRYLE